MTEDDRTDPDGRADQPWNWLATVSDDHGNDRHAQRRVPPAAERIRRNRPTRF